MGNLQIAASAEATSQAVNGEVTGETEAVHDSATLEHDADRGGRAASTSPPSDARGVDGAPVLEVGVVVQTMVGLSEGDARAAAGDQAWNVILVAAGWNGGYLRERGGRHTEINWLEELDEAVVPWLVGGGDGAGDGLGPVQGVGDAVGPVSHIVVSCCGTGDRSWLGCVWLLDNLLLRGRCVLRLGSLLLLGVIVGGHCDGFWRRRRSECDLSGWLNGV